MKRTPLDRAGAIDPQLIKKVPTRLASVDDRVLDIDAGGMPVRDIESHLRGLYRVEIWPRHDLPRHRRGA